MAGGTIHDYINECRSSIEEGNTNNAYRALDAMSAKARELHVFQIEKDSYKSALNLLKEQLMPASCYLSGLRQHYGRVTNSVLCPVEGAANAIAKAGVTLHRLLKDLK